jgi:hypothetical protein
VNDELKTIWKKVVVANLKTFSHLPGRTKKSHKYLSRQPIFGKRIEPEISE